MEERKTLIILSPGFPADENDSSCLPAQQAMVKAINKTNPEINVIIISFQYPYTKNPYQWFNNTVIPFDGQNKSKPKSVFPFSFLLQKSKRFFLWIRIWNQLDKLKQQGNVIGILSFWVGECAVLGYHFGRVKKIKHISWILGQDAKPENRYMKMMRIKGDSLAAMSDFLSDTFYKNYKIRPAQIIPNGIDTSLFSTETVERDIDIIGVGSLIPLKRYDLFILIIKKITLSFPNLKVMICGKGPEQAFLEDLILNSGLKNTIKITGEKPHAEVLNLLQRSKILMHTSSYEGFSGACLEALYAGAHVISFCKAQDTPIDHWHIVLHEEDMVKKTMELLQLKSPDYSPVLPYSIDDSAKAMTHLFTV